MELVQVNKESNKPVVKKSSNSIYEDFGLQVLSSNKEYKHNPFIEANTKSINLSTLKNDCIIPVFSKDNEKTLAHQEFIEIAQNCVSKVFSNHIIDAPEVRVSHQIKGRTADAIYKPVKELLDHEKTQYFERMAFIIRIPSITENINGNDVALTVGGVRSYNQENLYNRKTFEKFKFFIGFQNMVCCNMCISTDGYQDEMRVGNYLELQSKILELIQGYNAQNHLQEMKQLSEKNLSEKQFAQLIGRTRLYNYLPKQEKSLIPELLLNDGQISTVAKDYYLDNSFCRNDNGDINLWNVYNLFTGANKSSYIDSFLSRNVNAFDFTKGLGKAINGDSNHHWFLS
ncbi:DUF3871 family protein [Polaribacter sp. IC073]|uniref:DUF3871 family protein n=1 Tax=Polaribacter sp. IC073 TaxID=2508540 RepID=UPI0011BEDB85|nr:DUF3871 family protein [Polaribacter sp. IC073]TXD47775.1 DUF3871 family protein [Polaribacter sp. IC073]